MINWELGHNLAHYITSEDSEKLLRWCSLKPLLLLYTVKQIRENWWDQCNLNFILNILRLKIDEAKLEKVINTKWQWDYIEAAMVKIKNRKDKEFQEGKMWNQESIKKS